MKKKPFALLAALVLALALPVLAHEGMDHSVMSPTDRFIPAEAPRYPVGTQALLQADHMPGMQSAVAVVSGAFDTVLYAITYTRSDTGEVVKDHRWVIREEIQGFGEVPFQEGEFVTLLPGHISGMGGEGVLAEITLAVPGVAYMVDFTPLDGMEPVLNHQWVSEEELLPYGTLPGSPCCG